MKYVFEESDIKGGLKVKHKSKTYTVGYLVGLSSKDNRYGLIDPVDGAIFELMTKEKLAESLSGNYEPVCTTG